MCCRSGALPPKFVESCSIRNDSDGDVQVRVTYFKHPGEEETGSPHQHEVSLSTGQTHRAEGRIVKCGGCEFNSKIVSIEATLGDGRKMELHEPFDGVHVIEPDWLFTIDNQGIRSVSSNT